MIEVEMTSLEIAELCDKRHDNVMRDIKGKFLPKISPLKNEESIFKIKTGSYTNSRGKTYDMYILNKYAANAFVANYKLDHAMRVVERLRFLEKSLEEKQRELDVMKSVVWEVINGQAYVSQEQALKCAGIKHPRLFMKYLKGHSKFYEDIMFNRHFLKLRQCNSHGNKWHKFTKEGFKWLLEKREDINTWVDKCKQVEKEQKKMPF